MRSADRSRRIARVVNVLSNSAQGATASQIMAAVGASRATVYRDLELLRESGYSLETRTVNGETRYRAVGSGLARTALSPREQAALVLGRRALASLEGTRPVRVLDDLIRRAGSTAPERTAVRMQTTAGVADPTIVSVLQAAAAGQRQLLIRYRGVKDTHPKARTVHPVELSVVNQQVYLRAWDPSARGMRTFKAVRISFSKALRAKCAIPRRTLEKHEGVARAVKVWSDDPVEVRVRINAAAARYVHEWPLVPDQRIEPGPARAVDVCARVYGLVETMRWVLGWGGAAEALEPAELREHVATEIRRAIAHYARPPVSAKTRRIKRAQQPRARPRPRGVARS